MGEREIYLLPFLSRVETRARTRRVLYHYSSRSAVLAMSAFGVGISSPGFGSGRPPGFYATSIPTSSGKHTLDNFTVADLAARKAPVRQ